MSNRSLLHKNKKAQFVKYLKEQGATIEPSRPRSQLHHCWIALRFRMPGERGAHFLYDNLKNACFSVQNRTVGIIHRFLKREI